MLLGTLNSYRWNTTGITVLNSTQITEVSGIFFDLNDTLYMADEYNNYVVWKLLKNTTTPIIIAGQLQSSGSSSTQLNYPQDVYVDSKQNLYVSDYYNNRVQKYINGSRSGVTIAGILTTAGTALNVIGGARYFSLDPTETYMYIADSDSHRIMRFLTNSTSGTNGSIVAGGTGGGNTNTQLNYPWGIHYLPSVSSYLYIGNFHGHSVMAWLPGSASGILLAGTPGVAGSNATLLNSPVGLTIDTFLNIFVVDSGNHRVQMFCHNNQTGTAIAGTGVAGNSATQLNGPRGIAFDSSMNMYISDWVNKRIQKFLKL